MTPKNKAQALVNSYRIILMNEDTECGNEILCTSIAKQSALIAVDEIIEHNAYVSFGIKPSVYEYWQEVKTEIENL
jgi:hypothetical protein